MRDCGCILGMPHVHGDVAWTDDGTRKMGKWEHRFYRWFLLQPREIRLWAQRAAK